MKYITLITLLLYRFPCRLQQSHHLFLNVQSSFYALKLNIIILQKKDKLLHSNCLNQSTSKHRPQYKVFKKYILQTS